MSLKLTLTQLCSGKLARLVSRVSLGGYIGTMAFESQQSRESCKARLSVKGALFRVIYHRVLSSESLEVEKIEPIK